MARLSGASSPPNIALVAGCARSLVEPSDLDLDSRGAGRNGGNAVGALVEPSADGTLQTARLAELVS